MNDKNKLVALILSKKAWHGVLKIDVCTNTNTKSLYNGLREVVNSHSKTKLMKVKWETPKEENALLLTLKNEEINISKHHKNLHITV